MQEQDIPYGYCHCGCGEKTRLAPRDDPRHGHVKGAPVRYLKGHSHRGKIVSAETRAKLSAALSGERQANWKGDAASYRALHGYLCKHYPKRGICDECGAAGRTEYALIHGRTYSRDRSDYRELCHRCHMAYDLTSDTCKRGHPWTPETTLRHAKTGKRFCRICRDARRRLGGY